MYKNVPWTFLIFLIFNIFILNMSLPSDYCHFIHAGHYARILQSGHRETYAETVDRYISFVTKDAHFSDEECDELRQAILRCEVMPSMRAMMTAGAAAERDNVCIYNCAYLEIDTPRRFAEVMYILMSGTGVGFSCEIAAISKLPVIPAHIGSIDTVHVVDDSKQGWAEAYQLMVESLYQGGVPHIDYSLIRPAGAPLKTMGGRASGPEPLKKLIAFTKQVFMRAAGRQLTSKEVHDLVCVTAEIVTVGGVRRSALISLSELSDPVMRMAKTGEWWLAEQWLALANNSAVYEQRPELSEFVEEWQSLVDSHSGERGIFNRQATAIQASQNGRREVDGHRFGTNPCSEIILRPCQFCNLTEVVVRRDDDLESLKKKVRLATILGTLQCRFTNFPFLDPIWKRNCEEERLLGVSLTGICDNEFFSTFSAPLAAALSEMRAYAVTVNAEYADRFGINRSTAITCVKPSGTVSQLVDCASGIHPRWSQYYIRRVRIDKKDPLYTFLKEQGVECEDELLHPQDTAVFSFPMCAPSGAKLRQHMSAIDQLQLALLYQDRWCEHKTSCTVYVRDHEWADVGAWVWKHFDLLSGISFLPYDNGSYPQAPYDEITQNVWTQKQAAMPVVQWNKLVDYDRQHLGLFQRGKFVFACSGDNCEIVDLVQ